jgi:hypothetical protein
MPDTYLREQVPCHAIAGTAKCGELLFAWKKKKEADFGPP